MLTIAADPKHLGARIAITSVLHTWGSAMTHHPHVHMIVPGGGLSPDGARWIAAKPRLPPARAACSRALFRRLMLENARRGARGRQAAVLRRARAASPTPKPSPRFLAPLRQDEVVRLLPSARSPGPKPCSPISSRYTHRVAISNRRLIAADADGVTFKVKDYRIEGPGRYKTMTLATHEFIRRFLLHVLPKGFHRIRHYGLLANGQRKANLAKARELLRVKTIAPVDDDPARRRRRT